MIRRECRRFIGDTEAPAVPLRAFSYKEALERLTAPLDEQFVLDKLRGFDDGAEALAFARAAGIAIGYLRSLLPRRVRSTPTGPKNVPPSDQEVGKFARAFAVIQNPLVVFEDLNDGTLSREHVKALRTVYPSLYDEAKAAIFYAMQAMLGQRKSWELPYDKDKLLQIFLDTSTMTPGLAADLQRAFAEPEQQEQAGPPQGGQLSMNPEASMTPTQRIADK